MRDSLLSSTEEICKLFAQVWLRNLASLAPGTQAFVALAKYVVWLMKAFFAVNYKFTTYVKNFVKFFVVGEKLHYSSIRRRMIHAILSVHEESLHLKESSY
jgi:hypothetical protein